MMKKAFLLCASLLMCIGGANRLWAAPDPGDRFLEAYFLIQEGDAAQRSADWTKADTKFNGALEILKEIKSDSPDWNPHIIDFRLKYVSDRLAELKTKLEPSPAPAPTEATSVPTTTNAPPAQTASPVVAPPPMSEAPPSAPAGPTAVAPPAAPATPTQVAPPSAPAAPLPEAPPAAPAPPATPPAESEQVRQLRAELQRAHDQVQQLEAARDELNSKLQEQLSKVAPTQTTPQIEALLKQNQDLAAKLAAAQNEIAQVREQAAAVAPAAPATNVESEVVEQLRTELAAARSELKQTKEDLQTTRLELGTTKQALEKAQTDNAELRRSYDAIIAQLTDANKKLASAHAASEKDDEIIRQLRKENALLRVIAERNTFNGTTEAEDTDSNRSIPELRGWRPRNRAETTQTKPVNPAVSSAPEESSREKLVAKLTSPKKAPSESAPTIVANREPAAPPAKTATAAPASPPVVIAKASPPPSTKAPRPGSPSPTPDVQTLLSDARAALVAKDLATASAKYNTVLASQPDNIVALSNLAAIYYQQGRYDDAEQNLRKVIVAAPNNSNARSLLGVIYFRKGLIEDSFNELTRAVALDPRNAEAHNYLGIVLSEKGWNAAGEQEIRRAIELNPQYPDAHFNLAVIYAKQRTPKVELARYHYRKALDLGAQPDPELEALLKKLTAKATEAESEQTP